MIKIESLYGDDTWSIEISQDDETVKTIKNKYGDSLVKIMEEYNYAYFLTSDLNVVMGIKFIYG